MTWLRRNVKMRPRQDLDNSSWAARKEWHMRTLHASGTSASTTAAGLHLSAISPTAARQRHPSDPRAGAERPRTL